MYVIGTNHGEFGLNHCNEVHQLTKHNTKYEIKNIIRGYCNNIFIDSNDNFWACGHNEYGSCGIGTRESIQKLTQINYFKKNKIKIKNVYASISGFGTFWISDKNRLYANGKNNSGELGIKINNKYNNQYEPKLVKDLYNVIDAVSSSQYSLAICSISNKKIIIIIKYWLRINIIKIIPNDIINLIKTFSITHQVYSTLFGINCGNGHGEHEINDYDGRWKLIETLKNKDIIKIAAGYEHSMFLESTGIVWCCGNNYYGQLGLGKYIKKQYTPTEIKYFINNNIKIKDIKCGGNYNLAIDNKNKVYSWGHNHHGQCGNGTTNDIFIPKLIDSLKLYDIEKIKCGETHSYVCTNNGNNYLFGSNRDNECIKLDDDNNNVGLPHLITKQIDEYINNENNDKRIKNVYLGCENTIIVVGNK